MDWIKFDNDNLPDKYEEVIVATINGTVKAAIHNGNGKFSTYLEITHWMHMPEAPATEYKDPEIADAPVKKKRGRPKKA